MGNTEKQKGSRAATTQDILDICKMKHYRVGTNGVSNYFRLKALLAELGLTEDEAKQCLHP